MFRLFDSIVESICVYILITIIEPMRVLLASQPKRKPQKAARRRRITSNDLLPSVVQTIRKQRAMMSPETHYVPLPQRVSVTEQYLRNPQYLDSSKVNHYTSLH